MHKTVHEIVLCENEALTKVGHLKVFSLAGLMKDIGLKRRTCSPFAGRLAALDGTQQH